MQWQRIKRITIQAEILAIICLVPVVQSKATTEIILRSPYRIVLAADSRAVYDLSGSSTECKLFELRDIYATVSGLARYGRSYRVTDAIKEGFAGTGTFEAHVSSTALVLQRRLQKVLTSIQATNPSEYRDLTHPTNASSDLVQLAIAQTVNRQPMLGIIELRAAGTGNAITATTIVCPGSCRQNAQIFYFGYWEYIKPYVTASGRPRNIDSAASIDRLIRMEARAHPREVGVPINIIELNGSGTRWLQNGGNCSLPGVGW